MGLDTLGNAYFVQKDGEKLVSGVQIDSLNSVNEMLQQAHGIFFHRHADMALILACKNFGKKSYEKIVDALLDHPIFPISLSYCGLVLARETAEKSGNEDLAFKIADVLDKREEQIKKIGIFEYLKQIKLRTVDDPPHGEQMLGNPADVIAFAVENSDILALIALAEGRAHEFLDKETLNFIQKRIDNKKDPVVKAFLLYIVGDMVDQKQTDELLNSMESNASSIKSSISSLRRGDERKKTRSTS